MKTNFLFVLMIVAVFFSGNSFSQNNNTPKPQPQPTEEQAGTVINNYWYGVSPQEMMGGQPPQMEPGSQKMMMKNMVEQMTGSMNKSQRMRFKMVANSRLDVYDPQAVLTVAQQLNLTPKHPSPSYAAARCRRRNPPR